MKIQSLVKLFPLLVMLALAGEVAAAELPDFTALVEKNAPARQSNANPTAAPIQFDATICSRVSARRPKRFSRSIRLKSG